MAERAGLRPGDTILEVNGTPFRAVTHEEALKVSFYFHFPNQKHFLSRITQSALQFQFYREYEVFFFLLLFSKIFIYAKRFVSVSILYIFAYLYYLFLS